ncbi:MAG: condensation domain-containing protein, partial [Acidobacteriota bacterium]
MSELKSRVADLSPEKRALLAQRLKKVRGDATGTTIPRRSTELRRIPLSSAQERVWFEHQWDPDSPLYTESVLLRIEGNLELRHLHRALTEIVRRHEVLRTDFQQDEEGVSQVIHPVAKIELPVIDLSGIADTESGGEAEMLRLATSEARRAFDVSRTPLFRATLIRLGTQDHVLVFVVHHLIFDGWSAGVFFDELFNLYDSMAVDRPSPLGEPKLQYGDYAVWQRESLASVNLVEQLAYWKKQLGGELGRTGLPV